MIIQAKRSSGTLLRSRNESSKKYQAVYQHIFRTGNYPMLLNLLHLTAMINSHLQKRTRHNLSYTALWLDSNVIIFHKITLQFCERYQRQVSAAVWDVSVIKACQKRGFALQLNLNFSWEVRQKKLE